MSDSAISRIVSGSRVDDREAGRWGIEVLRVERNQRRGPGLYGRFGNHLVIHASASNTGRRDSGQQLQIGRGVQCGQSPTRNEVVVQSMPGLGGRDSIIRRKPREHGERFDDGVSGQNQGFAGCETPIDFALCLLLSTVRLGNNRDKTVRIDGEARHLSTALVPDFVNDPIDVLVGERRTGPVALRDKPAPFADEGDTSRLGLYRDLPVMNF